MPFDEENDEDLQSIKSQKTGLKKVSSQNSIFDNLPKKPTQKEFEEKVKDHQEKSNSYKFRAAELASQFNKAMADKTLAVNRNPFQKNVEKEILTKMIQLAIDINNDPSEDDGMGSLSWITLLLKTCFSQRDKINSLEHSIYKVEQAQSDLIKKISSLDIKKVNE